MLVQIGRDGLLFIILGGETYMVIAARLQEAYDRARADLLAERTPERHWEGQLSSSALATATAISALSLASRRAGDVNGGDAADGDGDRIEAGLRWLVKQQNADGGWGDTDKSHSNIATTMLTVAAVELAGRADSWRDQLARANTYIVAQGGIAGLRARYGNDKTFAVPILTNYALAGLVDWSVVAPLPFELAWVPQRFYRWMRIPVVSYAVPALVAIGHARFVHRPPKLPWMRLLRRLATVPTLRLLQGMQPDSGGYLEAVPLTSFVTMSLAAVNRNASVVVQRGLDFIRRSMRSDGSWPIDTNLATWNTSLATNALLADGQDVLPEVNLDWLLSCQHAGRHPFTGAAPGGWGWTDLSGAVPDVDDTAGALLALAGLLDLPQCPRAARRQIQESAHAGLHWLLGLQNRDGGWPTFCRGWGKLPFDRSGADLTAHALRALHWWRPRAAPSDQARVARALKRGVRFLQQCQRLDGSWVPLWFGHQDHPQEDNPVLGTARVLKAFQELGLAEHRPALRGYRWLASVQQPDGGWSGCVTQPGQLAPGAAPGSRVEETALAVDSLLGAPASVADRRGVSKGVEWLVEAVFAGRHRENSPIGLYFAKLWYHERLYPLIFTVAALGQAVRCRVCGSPPIPTENSILTSTPRRGPGSIES